MSASIWKWDWDYVVHAVVGFAVTALVGVGLHFTPPPMWFVWFMLPISLGIGILREKRQHNFDKLTAHQWLEGVLFGVGAIPAAVAAVVFL